MNGQQYVYVEIEHLGEGDGGLTEVTSTKVFPNRLVALKHLHKMYIDTRLHVDAYGHEEKSADYSDDGWFYVRSDETLTEGFIRELEIGADDGDEGEEDEGEEDDTETAAEKAHMNALESVCNAIAATMDYIRVKGAK